ncbi:MAG: hypothetical protein MN733_22965 [Nitrososphaera sp.]|nr:hypothetical protein [Nitrososphaera sp.]
MPFAFRNLDEQTRHFMVEEIEAAIRNDNLYFSKRFNSTGTASWPALLLEAARDYNEHWLAYQLETRGLMKGMEGSRTPSGGYTIKHVPDTAAETIADGQFNRYYILGLCRRALAEGKTQVFVYRAKEVHNPRSESERLIGSSYNPSELIEQIRPRQSSLGYELLKPNSGLSIYL